MRYLLYCIFRGRTHQEAKAVSGVGGGRVLLLSNDGVTAVVSEIPASDKAPDVRRILEYEKVIESFHRELTLVPMRYGCLFDGKSRVVRFLRERAGEYKKLLRELEGCVEMGIRVFVEKGECRSTDPGKSIRDAASQMPRTAHSGRAYLAARKAHYSRQERLSQEGIAVLERCRAAFDGFFVKCKPEEPRLRVHRCALNVQLPSLYFLVPREGVASFRKVFRRFKLTEPARLLLSGPWPPYNFVEDAPRTIRRRNRAVAGMTRCKQRETRFLRRAKQGHCPWRDPSVGEAPRESG